MPRDSIIFTDSRGADLQDFLWANNKRKDFSVSILANEIKGAGLRNLADMAISFSQDFPTYVIYIAGGVCDITWKDPRTKEIKFVHASQAALTTHVISILNEIDGRMYGCCPLTKFIICPIIGIYYVEIYSAHCCEHPWSTRNDHQRSNRHQHTYYPPKPEAWSQDAIPVFASTCVETQSVLPPSRVAL